MPASALTRLLFPSRHAAVNGAFWLMALIHLFIPLYNHAVFRSYGFDYAVYNFAFYDYAHFQISPCPLYMFPAPATFWQDHFSLLLPLLSPLYWIVTPLLGTYALIVIQWIFVAAGAFCTFRFVAGRSSNDLMPFLAVVCYFFIHGRFSAHRTDVNLAIIGSALVPVLLYYFDTGRWRAMWAVAALIFVSREDLSLWIAFIGLMLAVEYRGRRMFTKQALILAAASIGYFLLCMLVLIPVFLEDENKKFTLFEYNVLGADLGEALRYVIHDPLQVFKLLFINHSDTGYYDNVKRDFYIVYLVSGGFLLFFRPALFIALIPLLAKKMLNDNPFRWGLSSYYAIEFASIFPILLFIIICSVKYPVIRVTLGILTVALTVVTSYWVMQYPPESLHFPDDEKFNIYSTRFYDHGEDPEEIRSVLAMIPPDAEVSASGALTPHLSQRERPLYFPVKTDSSYVVLLRSTNAYPLQDPGYHYEIGRLLSNEKEWEKLYESRKLILFKGRAGRPEGPHR